MRKFFSIDAYGESLVRWARDYLVSGTSVSTSNLRRSYPWYTTLHLGMTAAFGRSASHEWWQASTSSQHGAAGRGDLLRMEKPRTSKPPAMKTGKWPPTERGTAKCSEVPCLLAWLVKTAMTGMTRDAVESLYTRESPAREIFKAWIRHWGLCVRIYLPLSWRYKSPSL